MRFIEFTFNIIVPRYHLKSKQKKRATAPQAVDLLFIAVSR